MNNSDNRSSPQNAPGLAPINERQATPQPRKESDPAAFWGEALQSRRPRSDRDETRNLQPKRSDGPTPSRAPVPHVTHEGSSDIPLEERQEDSVSAAGEENAGSEASELSRLSREDKARRDMRRAAREKAQRERDRQFAEAQAMLRQELSPLIEAKQIAKDNPLAAMEKLGLSVQDVVRYAVTNPPPPPPDPTVSRIEALEQEIRRYKEQEQQILAQRQQEADQQILSSWQSDGVKAVKDRAADFPELLAAEEKDGDSVWQQVLGIAADMVREKGVEPSFEEAAQEYEDRLLSARLLQEEKQRREAERKGEQVDVDLFGDERGEEKQERPAPPPAPRDDDGSWWDARSPLVTRPAGHGSIDRPSLSNSRTAAPIAGRSDSSGKVLSDEERRQRALAVLEGRLR